MFKEPSGLFISNESASWGVEMGEEVRRGEEEGGVELSQKKNQAYRQRKVNFSSPSFYFDIVRQHHGRIHFALYSVL